MTVSGLLGILVGLGLLISFAFRGWSVLLLAPLAALIAALFSREPLLAHWTQTFMGGTARFLAQCRAAGILVEGRIDGDHTPWRVVAGLEGTAPAAFSSEATGDGGTRLAKTEQRDDARR